MPNALDLMIPQTCVGGGRVSACVREFVCVLGVREKIFRETGYVCVRCVGGKGVERGSESERGGGGGEETPFLR